MTNIIVTEEEYGKRNNDVTNFFHRLNSSVLLSLLFENMGEISIKREDLVHINNYEISPNDTTIDPYDPNFVDYIKDIGGHVIVKFDAESDTVKMNVVSHEDGEAQLQEKETVGFFSIRRPWNIHGFQNQNEGK